VGHRFGLGFGVEAFDPFRIEVYGLRNALTFRLFLDRVDARNINDLFDVGSEASAITLCRAIDIDRVDLGVVTRSDAHYPGRMNQIEIIMVRISKKGTRLSGSVTSP
jgi:hypothetical protein